MDLSSVDIMKNIIRLVVRNTIHCDYGKYYIIFVNDSRLILHTIRRTNNNSSRMTFVMKLMFLALLPGVHPVWMLSYIFRETRIAPIHDVRGFSISAKYGHVMRTIGPSFNYYFRYVVAGRLILL